MKTTLTRAGLFSGGLLGFMLIASAADSPYPHANETIGTVRQVYDGALFPDIQANTFRNIDRLFPTRTVRAGDSPSPLPSAELQIQNLHFTSRDKEYDLYDYLSLNRVSGIIVIKDGEVAFEKYLLGNTPDTKWMSMSVVKSMTATLVGMAIKDGYIYRAGLEGCNEESNDECTCTANRACVELERYIEVPFYLRQALDAYGLADPSPRGLRD